MPIYEYRCSACGYQNDYLQKISEPPLTDCPECGKSTFSKQVTAAGFQLKGTGWYATDFKNNGTSKAGANSKPSAKNGGEAGKADSGGSKAAEGASTSSSGAGDSAGGSSGAPQGAGASPACT